MPKKIKQEGLFSDLGRAAQKTFRASEKNKPSKTGIKDTLKAFLSPQRSLSGQSTVDRMAQNKFINNFVSRGMDSLNNAIQMGLADPNSNVLDTDKPAPTPSTDKTPKSGEPQISFQGKPVASTASNLLKVPAPIGGGSQTVTTKTSTLGANQPATPKTAPAQSFKQKAADYKKKQELLKAKGARNMPVKEHQTYEKLNNIFESYILLLEQTQPSISQWFKTNFLNTYLKGIDMSSAEPKINEILKNMPNSIKSGKIRKDLQDIAKIAWTLGYTSRRYT